MNTIMMMTVLFVVCDDDSVITITVDCNHTTYDGRFYHLFLFLYILIGRSVGRGWSGMCVIALYYYFTTIHVIHLVNRSFCVRYQYFEPI